MLSEGLVYVLITQALRLVVNTSPLVNIRHDTDLGKSTHSNTFGTQTLERWDEFGHFLKAPLFGC